MTPLSCSLVVRALASPALVNDPLFLLLTVRAFVGSALVHDCLLFLLSAGIGIFVLVTAHETTPAWYSSLGSSPVGTPLIRVGASRRTPFCDVFRLSRVG